MPNSYHAIDLDNISITPAMTGNFYQYMIQGNRSVFFVPESDRELIDAYGLSSADIKLLYEAHLTHLDSAQAHCQRVAKTQLSSDKLTELVADEFTPRVKTIKQQNKCSIEFEYRTASNNRKIAVYTVTAPEGVGFQLHCHTRKPNGRHSIKGGNTIPIGLGTRLMTESKPKQLGGDKPLSRFDVYKLILDDAAKRKANLHFDMETKDETALELPYETTLFQRRMIALLDIFDFPQVGKKLSECFSDNSIGAETKTVKAIINKKVNDRYELLDAQTYDVLGFLDKNASRDSLPMALTVSVIQGSTCYRIAARLSS